MEYNINNFTETRQKYLLEIAISNPDVFSRCQNILNPIYFHNTLKPTVKYILDYFEQYKTIPSHDDINSLFEHLKMEPKVKGVHEHQPALNDIEAFCRQKALEEAVYKATTLIKEQKYGSLDALFKEAMQVQLQTDLGTSYYENPEERINAIYDAQGTISTGLVDLDYRLFGGFGPGELNLFVAQSGAGKSMAMQNLATNFSRRGMNGIYITLELSEELVCSRIDSINLGRSKGLIKSDIKGAAEAIIMQRFDRGAIHVKRMPESVTKVNDIRVYINNYKLTAGLKLDYLCVDYLDLLNTDRVAGGSDTFLKDKYVSEELRALAFELGIPVISASQLNRGGVETTEYTQANIAGGISKINTADNVIAIRNNDSSRARGEIYFEFLKTRNSSGVNVKCGFDVNTMRIFDHPDSPNLGNTRYTAAQLSKAISNPNTATSSNIPFETPVDTVFAEEDLPPFDIGTPYSNTPSVQAVNNNNNNVVKTANKGATSLRNVIASRSKRGV